MTEAWIALCVLSFIFVMAPVVGATLDLWYRRTHREEIIALMEAAGRPLCPCGGGLRKPRRGPWPTYCSQACKQKAYRQRKARPGQVIREWRKRP